MTSFEDAIIRLRANKALLHKKYPALSKKAGKKVRRKTVIVLTILIILMTSLSFELYAKKKSVIVLVGATLIDGTGSDPVRNTTVLIEGNKLKAVGPKHKVSIPEGAKKIDVSGRWVLPGFIDLHMHLTYPPRFDMEFTDTGSLQTLRALNVMNKYLKSGVTSVRDVASPVEPMQALKLATLMGYTNTIRLFSVGEGIVSTGGHGEILRATRAAEIYRNFLFVLAANLSQFSSISTD